MTLSEKRCKPYALKENGVGPKTASSMPGHCDAGFTLSTYTHAAKQKQNEAAETMGNFMGAGHVRG